MGIDDFLIQLVKYWIWRNFYFEGMDIRNAESDKDLPLGRAELVFDLYSSRDNSCIRSLGNLLQKGSCIRFQSCSYLRNLRRPFLPGHRIIVHFPDAYFIEQKFIFFRRFCYSLPNSGECSTWNYFADFKSQRRGLWCKVNKKTSLFLSHWSSRTFVLGRMVCRTSSGIRSCSTALET